MGDVALQGGCAAMRRIDGIEIEARSRQACSVNRAGLGGLIAGKSFGVKWNSANEPYLNFATNLTALARHRQASNRTFIKKFSRSVFKRIRAHWPRSEKFRGCQPFFFAQWWGKYSR
ncbi:hypothetical protein [Rhizobium brockwellii]